MKARRKSDGKIIEVKEWRGASDVIYSSPDMNQFYQASELDFNIDAEDTVIQGWVCRDQDGNLALFVGSKPYKQEGMDYWSVPHGRSLEYLNLNPALFPDLTWSDDPIEVEIIIKRKKNG